MKALVFVAATLLAACDGSYPVAEEECAAGRVCIEVWQEGEEVSFQITNNTYDMVTLPEFAGLGTPMNASIELSSDRPDVDAPVSSGGSPIAGPSSDTVLRPQGWVGFTLTAEDVRKAYRLSEGCQNVNVAYRINRGGAKYFLGSVQGGSAKLCL
ncbi:hypothetical protein [Pseudoxanthomonas sp. PXM02]|uniref:hypothetical protein n=1 Tax=Pseudoxanthomonas sp. PXM02 TaxID=2769294 RepID=UPI001783240E|nr:hypothetical protein [Pseudoxanthomonas sp. PXM02]MBD9481162.1 hypothetical protein [Pseudoxanthomonas sp. PXM02]